MYILWLDTIELIMRKFFKFIVFAVLFTLIGFMNKNITVPERLYLNEYSNIYNT